MADPIKVRVPLTGEHVTPHGEAPQQQQEQPRPESGFVHGVYQPPEGRVSLHRVRLAPIMAKRAAEAETKVPAPAPRPQAEALNQQMATLQTAVTALAASQLATHSQGSYNARRGYGYDEPDRGAETLDKLMLHNQYGGGPYTGDGRQFTVAPDQPDPLNHDFYDDDSAAEFHHLNNGYIQREVQRGVEAERAARQKASEGETLHKQLDAAEAKFKRDTNYAETMRAAIDRAADSGWKLPLEEAYLQVSNETEARSGRRRSSYLPKDLKTLGAIMRYHRDTGRIDR